MVCINQGHSKSWGQVYKQNMTLYVLIYVGWLDCTAYLNINNVISICTYVHTYSTFLHVYYISLFSSLVPEALEQPIWVSIVGVCATHIYNIMHVHD